MRDAAGGSCTCRCASVAVIICTVVAGAGLTVDRLGASLAYPGKKAFLAFVETQVRRETVSGSPPSRPVRRARAVGETGASCADALVPGPWHALRQWRQHPMALGCDTGSEGAVANGRTTTSACAHQMTIAIRRNRYPTRLPPAQRQPPPTDYSVQGLARRVAVCERAGDGMRPLDTRPTVILVRCAARPLTSRTQRTGFSRETWRERRTLRGRYRRSSRCHSYTPANGGRSSAMSPGSGSAVNLAQAAPGD